MRCVVLTLAGSPAHADSEVLIRPGLAGHSTAGLIDAPYYPGTPPLPFCRPRLVKGSVAGDSLHFWSPRPPTNTSLPGQSFPA